MTKTEYNRYSMYRTVITIMTEYNTIVQTMQALSAAVVELNGSVGVIERKDADYLNASKGTTIHKHSVEDELIEQIMILASSLFVFGHQNSDSRICEIADVKESLLKKMRDSELLQKGKSIAELLVPNQANLADFGIDENMITSYSTKITEYSNALNSKDNKHVESVASRDELHTAFSVTDGILKNKIDRLMEHMRARDVTFFNKYQQARVIKDLGIRHQKDEKPVPAAVEVK